MAVTELLDSRDDGAAGTVPLGGPGASPRQGAERRQAALAEIGRESLGAASAELFLLDAARIAAAALDLEFAGAVRVQGDTSLLLQWSRANRKVPADNDALVLPAAPSSSAWAFALAAQTPLTISHAEYEKRFDAAGLRRLGIQAGVICPLAFGKRTLGAFGVFDLQPRTFAEEELTFLESAAVVLASATARRQAEQALADQTQFLSSAVDNMDGLVVVLSPSGLVEKFNDACRWLTGLTDEEVRGKPLWESFLPFDQAPAVQDAFDRLRQGEASVRIESRLPSRVPGDRRIVWTFTIVQREDGRLQSIVGSGVEAARRAVSREPARDVETTTEKNQSVLATLERYLREGQLPPREVLDDLLDLQESDEFIRPSENDQRTRGRRPYPYMQRVAPWSGNRLPSQRTFFEVRCRDISAQGVSFFMPRRPEFERLVISLGPGENKVYVIAEVRHVTPFNVEGKSAYLVGCEFLARVYY
jgi:PAS domain S-box-containing protein